MITSLENQQVKNLIQLKSKAKYRNKQGLFVAEGIKMFLEAPKHMIHKVYVSESFYEQEENKKLFLEQIGETPYEILSDHVFKAASDTMTPQGVLTVLYQHEYQLDDLLKDDTIPCILVLESIQDPGNLGTMLRAGEGAGVTGVLMNHTTVDLYNPKTIRSTMGSIYRMPFYCTKDLKGDILRLKKEKIMVCAAHLHGTMDYDEADYSRGCAFLIGNEGNGLTDETSSLADTLIKIPMEGKVESLNAAVAASLLVYEAKRQRKEQGKKNVSHVG